MLGFIQMTPGWVNEDVWIQDRRWCRVCRGKRGLTPPEGHQTKGGEAGTGQE